MTALRTILICLAMLGGFGAAWVRMDARLNSLDAELRVAAEKEHAARAPEIDRPGSPIRESSRAPGRLGDSSERDRLIQFLGGPVPAALKNPDTTIAGCIEEVARALIPEATQVAVKVDRFVEFQLIVELPRAIGEESLASWSLGLWEPLQPYLHAIRFLFNGVVLADLDRHSMEEALRPGGPSPLVGLVRELRGRGAASQRTAQPVPTSPSPAPAATPRREQDPETRILLRANEELGQGIQAKSKELGEGLRELNDTINRLGREGAAGLSPARESIQQFRERLPQIRAFLADPGGQLDRLLQDAGTDEVYRRASVRTFRQEYGASRDAERMISQVHRYCDVLMAFLNTMEKHRVGWTVIPEVQKIQFLDSDLFEVYREAAGACEREQKATQVAIEAWQTAASRGHPGGSGR